VNHCISQVDPGFAAWTSLQGMLAVTANFGKRLEHKANVKVNVRVGNGRFLRLRGNLSD